MKNENKYGNGKTESAIFGTLFAGAPEPESLQSLPDCYPPSDPAHFDKTTRTKALRGRHSGATYSVEYKRFFERVFGSSKGPERMEIAMFEITRKDYRSGKEETDLFSFKMPAFEKPSGYIPIPAAYEHAVNLYAELTSLSKDPFCPEYHGDETHPYVSIPFRGNAQNVRVVAFCPKATSEEATLVIEECYLQEPSRDYFVNVIGKNRGVTSK